MARRVLGVVPSPYSPAVLPPISLRKQLEAWMPTSLSYAIHTWDMADVLATDSDAATYCIPDDTDKKSFWIMHKYTYDVSLCKHIANSRKWRFIAIAHEEADHRIERQMEQ